MSEKEKDIDIIKHNNLIRGKDNLKLAERRFTNLILSKLTKDKTVIEFTTKDMTECLGIEADWSNSKRLLKTIMSKVIEFKDPTTGKNVLSILFRKLEHKDGYYELQLEDTLIPYLLEFKDNVKGCFTMFKTCILQQFEFKHTQRVYELLKSWLTIGKYKYDLEELKYQLNIPNYETKFFFKQVLDIAIKEINSKSDIYVEYTKDKSTRVIHYINFTIKQNPNYKYEESKQESIVNNPVIAPKSNPEPTKHVEKTTKNPVLSPDMEEIVGVFKKYEIKVYPTQYTALQTILDNFGSKELMIEDIIAFIDNDNVDIKQVGTYIKWERTYPVNNSSTDSDFVFNN